jgi:predicted nucleotidyltransferase
MISEETINKAVDRLLQVSKPLKIFLFGSYARGDAREHSDLDFLVVEREIRSRREEMVRLHDALRPMRIPVDIVVAQESTFDKWCDVPGTVFNEAKTKGRLCYESS